MDEGRFIGTLVQVFLIEPADYGSDNKVGICEGVLTEWNEFAIVLTRPDSGFFIIPTENVAVISSLPNDQARP
jgi:hypothetical protein